jgi:ribosomal protein S27E
MNMERKSHTYAPIHGAAATSESAEEYGASVQCPLCGKTLARATSRAEVRGLLVWCKGCRSEVKILIAQKLEA